MRRNPRAYLWDVLDASRSIHEFLNHITPESFADDALVRSAVERQLAIVGEALNQLAMVAPDIAQRIPELRRIIAVRNILIHGYAVVDPREIWRMVHENLPDLHVAVQRQLDAMGEGD